MTHFEIGCAAVMRFRLHKILDTFSPPFAIERFSFSMLAAIILTISLVFLQEGFTYYISFQLLALAIVTLLAFSTIHTIKFKKHFFFAFLAFSLSVVITAVVSPDVIASNSSNMFLTAIGVIGYAAMIGYLPNQRINRAGLVLNVLRYASSATILALASLITLAKSQLVPSLTNESFLKQNSRLIDNATDAQALADNLKFQIDQHVQIDLFYGEPSFLAIVLFTCLGCFMFTSKLIAHAGKENQFTSLESRLKLQTPIILIGIACLLYVQSFSAIIYALITTTYFAFIKLQIGRKNLLKSIGLLIVIAAVFLTFSYEYFLYRIASIGESVSFSQRFGFLWNMSIEDILFGIKDESMLPGVGIHNGLYYIIAISGLGGVLYLASLLYLVHTLSVPIKSSLFALLLMLAIMMQNGGVFSPSKVVLFSLILLPLACVRTVYSVQHPTPNNARHHE